MLWCQQSELNVHAGLCRLEGRMGDIGHAACHWRHIMGGQLYRRINFGGAWVTLSMLCYSTSQHGAASYMCPPPCWNIKGQLYRRIS